MTSKWDFLVFDSVLITAKMTIARTVRSFRHVDKKVNLLQRLICSERSFTSLTDARRHIKDIRCLIEVRIPKTTEPLLEYVGTLNCHIMNKDMLANEARFICNEIVDYLLGVAKIMKDARTYLDSLHRKLC
jgi:hypothetical protein